MNTKSQNKFNGAKSLLLKTLYPIKIKEGSR